MVACSDPPGLTLEVVPLDGTISRVEVYLADHCDTCPGVMSPPMMRPRTANMFETNYSQVFAATSDDSTNWQNGHALFRITSPDANDSRVSYLLAIGFNHNGVPIALNRYQDVTIPASSSSYWQVPLDEPLQVLTDAPSDQERIAIWPMTRPSGPRCVLIENAGGGRVDAVVPHDDPDCDGITANECAPYTPSAVAVAPTIADARCVAPAPPVVTSNGTMPGVCLLGGPPCTDGQAATGCEYLDTDYCVPQALCSCTDWETCTRVKISSADTATGVPYVACNIAMQLDGGQCGDSSFRSADIIATDFIQGGATKCKSITVSDTMLPLAFTNKMTIGGATLEIKDFQEPCSATLDWSGDYMRAAGMLHGLLLDLELDNGKHMVVPYVIHMADSCLKPSACTRMIPNTGESMLTCARPAPDSTTCLAQTSCPNGGIMCGARCCGRGENCMDGECRCGAAPHCVGDTHFCVTSSGGNPGITGCGDVCCGLPGTPMCPP